MESVHRFYVHLADNNSIIDSLTGDLQEFYDSTDAVHVNNVVVGSTVVARFSDDNAWYRGVVNGFDDDKVNVMFVDFGNSDTVALSELRELENKFRQLPAHAVCCSLSGVCPLSKSGDWNGDEKKFLEIISKNGVVCQFRRCTNGIYEVDVYLNELSVASEMIACGLVKEDGLGDSNDHHLQLRHATFNNGQTVRACLSYVGTGDSFFVQTVSSIGDLKALMNEMQAYYVAGKGTPLTHPKVCTVNKLLM